MESARGEKHHCSLVGVQCTGREEPTGIGSEEIRVLQSEC